jgi:hypothetical protein
VIFRSVASLLVIGASVALLSAPTRAQHATSPGADTRQQNQTCLQCHSGMNPGLVEEWRASAHAQSNVGCYDCHRAEKTDADAFEHNGTTIAVIVSPKDCSGCHQR